MRCWIFSAVSCIVLYSLVGGYLDSPPPTVESIVAEWGTGNPEHDRYVVDALLGSTDGVDRYGMRMEPRLLDALTKRIGEKPELLRQVFRGWFYLGGSPPPCDEDEWFIALWLSNWQSLIDSENVSRQCLFILIAAAVFEKPEWLVDLKMDDVPTRWQVVSEWLDDVKYYAVYDRDADVYVVDEAARRAGTRVAPARQSWGNCN